MGTPLPLPKRGLCPPNFQPMFIVPNSSMDQDATWHEGRPRWLCVRWGSSPIPTNGVEPPPQFSTHFCCGQTAGCTKMPVGMEIGLHPGDFVLDGEPAPFPKRRRSPQFSTHVYCGQTAGWIKMALGVEVGLGPGLSNLNGHFCCLKHFWLSCLGKYCMY